MALSSCPPTNYRRNLEPFGSCHPVRSTWQEWFSWAVVSSIATSCGLVAHPLPVDANRKDMQVETWGLLAGRQRTIALQLKSTVNPNFVDGGAHVTYDLPRATYDDLFAPAAALPSDRRGL